MWCGEQVYVEKAARAVRRMRADRDRAAATAQPQGADEAAGAPFTRVDNFSACSSLSAAMIVVCPEEFEHGLVPGTRPCTTV